MYIINGQSLLILVSGQETKILTIVLMCQWKFKIAHITIKPVIKVEP